MMRQILLCLFISMFACSASAEPFKVTGKVVDAEDSTQLYGVTVKVIGTNCVTTADYGNFSIEVEKGEILKFSYAGYYPKVVEVLNDSSLFVEMRAWHEFCFCPVRHVILPENLLKSTLREIQCLYPGFIQKNDTGNMITYQSESGNSSLSLYNGIVYKQYDSLNHQNISMSSLYNIITTYGFKGYVSVKKRKSGKEITFYYPEYSVKVQYNPQKQVSITYELYPQYYK